MGRRNHTLAQGVAQMFRRKPTRRGVILLVVLSLIVLFTLIAVTYAIVASQYKMTARAAAKLEIVGDPPRKDLDMAAYLAVRDSNVKSSLTGHSLLRDLYGLDGVRGRITTSAADLNSQFITITFTQVSGTFSSQSAYYNGCVFSLVTGDQKGYSTRVVGYDPNGTLRVESHDHDGVSLSLPSSGNEFVINGRPFNGTGFGYSPPTSAGSPIPALNNTANIPNLPLGMLPSTDVPVAFAPHFQGYASSTSIQMDVGGADEDYDAPDAQNMHIAMVPPAVIASNEILPSFHRPDLLAFWIKWLQTRSLTSLSPPEVRLIFAYPYGPDLIPGTADETVAPWSSVTIDIRRAILELKRRTVFRPLPEDHPNFNGGNPMFTVLAGTTLGSLDADGDGRVDRWDVDNDGDGIADSVWVDPGLPPVTAEDGRQYKKLFAYLIRDMDGRINVNAMGSLAQSGSGASYLNATSDAGSLGLNGMTGVVLPAGFGTGPADAYIGDFFGTNTLTVMQGRYGGDHQPGFSGTDDLLSAVKCLGIPNNYNSQPYGFGSPPDLGGRGAVYIDFRGQPKFSGLGAAGETTDDPYETEPLRNRGVDAMYTAGELERVLRYKDADVNQLPNRLESAAQTTFDAAANRMRVTTHSSHIPVSYSSLPFELRTNNGNTGAAYNYLQALQNNSHAGVSLLDIYRAKLLQGGFSSANVANEMNKIVPFEVLHGQRFDINRWLGNGRDDNSNGTVDEPAEQASGEIIWSNTAPTQFQNVSFSYANDNPEAADSRQLFARHLYCLMRAVMDENYQDSFPNAPDVGANAAIQREYTYRRLAQWAINVVDFRDPDAIMTPFEYDINPWNGWICDGNLATDESTINYTSNNLDDNGNGTVDEAAEATMGQDRRVVWGVEYPDLMLMETLAFHDRRVKDTDHDVLGSFPGQGNGPPVPPPGLNKKRDATNMPDLTLDQYRIPQGSLFFELYCPRNSQANNAALPRELYDANGRLDVGRVAPARTIPMFGQVRHPIWRAVVTQNTADGNVFARAATRRVTGEMTPRSDKYAASERILWFAPLNPSNHPEANMVFFGQTGAVANQPNGQLQASSNVVMSPGTYLMACPRATTPIGSRTNGNDGNPLTPDDSQHVLGIDASLNFSVQGGSYVYPPNSEQIQQPQGIVIAALPPPSWSQPMQQNWRVGMNVSEPLPRSGTYYVEPRFGDAYANLTMPFNNSAMNPNYTYNTPFDEDAAYGGPLRTHPDRVRTGTRADFRSLFLQRLANPLAAWNPEPNDPEFGTYFDSNLPVNPYITVDWASVDLTVFSGDENTNRQIMVGMNPPEWIDENSDPNPYNEAPPEMFQTRRRGNPADLGAMATFDNHFWPPRAKSVEASGATTGDADQNFNHLLTHNFGYLNVSTYGPVLTTPPAGYVGAPQTPFPWLAWHNRPFVNPLELMMVPTSSQDKLCYEWGLAQGSQPIYDGAQSATAAIDPARQPYSYLLNFFLTSTTEDGTKVAKMTAGEAPHYYRLFDHVETPSLFTGTEKWYNPATFASGGTAAASFRPPYNRLSRFREPGRININTIFDYQEWLAIAKGFPAYSDTGFFDTFVTSRRGYVANASTYGNYPTIFNSPFRGGAAADLAVNLPAFGDYRRSGVESGLLRPHPTAVSLTSADRPLFAFPSTNGFDNTSRNPYFALKGINRLSNMVSTQSNVYAMWITVGYFYTEPTAVSAVHPEGLRLAQEVGSDQGTVERHRAFYLIDRSAPVAFEPGENHNVDRLFLIRRFIE